MVANFDLAKERFREQKYELDQSLVDMQTYKDNPSFELQCNEDRQDRPDLDCLRLNNNANQGNWANIYHAVHMYHHLYLLHLHAWVSLGVARQSPFRRLLVL